MRDTIILLVAKHPNAARWIGKCLFGACMALAVFGVRIDRISNRLAGLANRFSVEAPSVTDSLPWWFGWAVPESIGGWFLLAVVALSAVTLARTARVLEKY